MLLFFYMDQLSAGAEKLFLAGFGWLMLLSALRPRLFVAYFNRS
jgi:hypothetical protein